MRRSLVVVETAAHLSTGLFLGPPVAFLYFADALDLSETPEKAVSIALLIRVCQLVLAAVALVAGSVWKARPRMT